MNYGRWRTQIPTHAFESRDETLMHSSLTQNKLTARAFPASRYSPGYLQPPTETPRCSYSMMLWRRVALTAATQIEKTDFMAAARFELAAHVNAPARQLAEQEPQPKTTRRDTKQGCDSGGVDLPAKRKGGQGGNERWRVCVPFIPLMQGIVLSSQFAQRETVSISGRCHGRGENFNLRG